MDRTDVENIINQKVKDNTTRDITPADMRDALSAILDWAEDNGVSPKLLTATANKSFTIPAGKNLISVVVLTTGALAGFGIGTTSGVFDISPAIPVGANDKEEISLNKYAKTDTDIWFNGITSQVTIKIYMS